jgi:hypothetical protein
MLTVFPGRLDTGVKTRGACVVNAEIEDRAVTMIGLDTSSERRFRRLKEKKDENGKRSQKGDPANPGPFV